MFYEEGKGLGRLSKQWWGRPFETEEEWFPKIFQSTRSEEGVWGCSEPRPAEEENKEIKVQKRDGVFKEWFRQGMGQAMFEKWDMQGSPSNEGLPEQLIWKEKRTIGRLLAFEKGRKVYEDGPLRSCEGPSGCWIWPIPHKARRLRIVHCTWWLRLRFQCAAQEKVRQDDFIEPEFEIYKLCNTHETTVCKQLHRWKSDQVHCLAFCYIFCIADDARY